MSKKVKYLPRQNPIKLKLSCKLTPGRQEIIRKGSRRRRYRSIKEQGTIDPRVKSRYSITSKAGLIQGIP